MGQVSVNRSRGKIDKIELLMSDQKKIGQVYSALQMGASLRAVSAGIGINPNTLSKWIRWGLERKGSLYEEFREGVLRAIGEATCDAEMRVAESDPKFYLKNGAAKVLMGDYYNTEDPKNETVYNIDNTITHHSNADDLSFQPPTVERLDSDNAEAISQHIDQEKLFEVLSVLRENGQDINQLVDDRMKQIKLQDSARKN